LIGTTQACLFRDAHTHVTSTGYSIYGLSTDSPNANTNFKTKQKLQYSLLCDPKATLIDAIGFKKHPKGTTRGVVVFDKSGKVIAHEAGGPQATVDTVMRLIIGGGGASANGGANGAAKAEPAPVSTDPTTEASAPLEPVKSKEEQDKDTANVAADVADSAAKLDNGVVV
jgi:peroxiredoxin Q/BCP